MKGLSPADRRHWQVRADQRRHSFLDGSATCRPRPRKILQVLQEQIVQLRVGSETVRTDAPDRRHAPRPHGRGGCSVQTLLPAESSRSTSTARERGDDLPRWSATCAASAEMGRDVREVARRDGLTGPVLLAGQRPRTAKRAGNRRAARRPAPSWFPFRPRLAAARRPDPSADGEILVALKPGHRPRRTMCSFA
jgi:hypothetical protein